MEPTVSTMIDPWSSDTDFQEEAVATRKERGPRAGHVERLHFTSVKDAEQEDRRPKSTATIPLLLELAADSEVTFALFSFSFLSELG